MGEVRVIEGTPINAILLEPLIPSIRLDYVTDGMRTQVQVLAPDFEPSEHLDAPSGAVLMVEGYDWASARPDPGSPVYVLMLSLTHLEEQQGRASAIERIMKAAMAPPTEEEVLASLNAALEHNAPTSPAFTVSVRVESLEGWLTTHLGSHEGAVLPKGTRLQRIFDGPDQGFFGPVYDDLKGGVVETVETVEILTPEHLIVSVSVVGVDQ